MKNLNFSKFLFIPLLCAGFAANAQNNSLTGDAQPVAATPTNTVIQIAKPVNFNPLASEKTLFEQKSMLKNARFADGSASGFGFGVEAEALLPLGNFKNSVSFGGGLNAVVLYHVSDAGAVTGSVGYNYFSSKEDVDYTYSGIPLRVGYLAKVGDMFFVEPQVGAYSLRVSDDSGNSASDTNLLLAAKVGVNINERGHIGVGYNYIKASGGSLSFASLNIIAKF